MTTRSLILPPPARAGGGEIPVPPAWQTFFFLAALWRPRYLIEIRHWEQGGRARQSWFPSPYAATRHVVKLPAENVFVGVVPRKQPGGGRDALAATNNVLWAECDELMATERLPELRPHITVRSSTRGKVHAYWFCREQMMLADVERGNRRLAFHLGADLNACDQARILRVPGSNHMKTGEPLPVRITGWDVRPNMPAREVCGHLPDQPLPKTRTVTRPRLANPDRDRLAAIPATEYVPALTGREVVRGMVSCPFHGGGQERTPSFSVTGPQDTLWFCFGCDRGGDIFTLAGDLWNLDPHTQFPEILDRLKGAFA